MSGILNNAFRKIFTIYSYTVAYECVVLFHSTVSNAIYRRKVKFSTKLFHYDNIVRTVFTDNRELASFASNLTQSLCVLIGNTGRLST